MLIKAIGQLQAKTFIFLKLFKYNIKLTQISKAYENEKLRLLLFNLHRSSTEPAKQF